jgi:hypothetical protein
VDRTDSGKCKWHRAFFWLRLLGVEEPCRLYVGAAESVVPQPRVGNEVHEVRSAWRLQVSNASVNQPQRTRTYFLWSCSVPPPAHGTRRVLEHTSTLRRAVRVDRGRLEVPVTPRRSRYPFSAVFFAATAPIGLPRLAGAPGPVPLGCPSQVRIASEKIPLWRRTSTWHLSPVCYRTGRVELELDRPRSGEIVSSPTSGSKNR